MAKLSFNKLKLKTLEETVNIVINEQEIEVKKYLPIINKLELVGNVLTNSVDENKFWNIGKLDLFFTLEAIKYYTNITFTDKQLEAPDKLYDTIETNHLFSQIKNAIGDDLEKVYDMLIETVEAIYVYNNSAMGILDSISSDYSNLDLDASKIQQKLADPNMLAFLKEVMDKLG